MTLALALASPDDSDERLALIEHTIAFVVRVYCRSAEEAEDFSSHAWVTVLEGDFRIASNPPRTECVRGIAPTRVRDQWLVAARGTPIRPPAHGTRPARA